MECSSQIILQIQKMFGQLKLSSIVLACLIAGIAYVHGDGNNQCENGGTQQQGVHPKCNCPSGFKGFNCSQRVTPCEGRPCRNHGMCTEQNDTFTCKCPKAYRGVLCEKKVLPCDSGPCKNGGTCINKDIKCFKCECTSGFKGPDCSEIVKPCEIKPCKNGGTCTNRNDGTFHCTCPKGFGGIFCDRQDALYSSVILKGRTKDLQLLEGWLNGKRGWRLCYRATQHGWAAATFHRNCDHKAPTVTIVRVGVYIFGVYVDVAFGGNNAYKASSKAFIFSFRNKDNVPPFKANVFRSTYAVYTNRGYGPTFGGGHDIHISNNANANSNSYANFGQAYRPPNGYTFAQSNTRNLLAGSRNFRPSEVEVFYLI